MGVRAEVPVLISLLNDVLLLLRTSVALAKRQAEGLEESPSTGSSDETLFD